MSLDLFVYYDSLPADFSSKVEKGLRENGFDLPVQLSSDGDVTCIRIGASNEKGETGELSIAAWSSPLKIIGAGNKAQIIIPSDQANNSVFTTRKRQAANELHFSHQHVCGERGVQLMYASAAVVSAAVNGGLYLDPSDDGLLLPESALTRARYWATIFDAQQRSAVLIAATPRKVVSEFIFRIVLSH